MSLANFYQHFMSANMSIYNCRITLCSKNHVIETALEDGLSCVNFDIPFPACPIDVALFSRHESGVIPYSQVKITC
jgi:hypothetical protein